MDSYQANFPTLASHALSVTENVLVGQCFTPGLKLKLLPKDCTVGNILLLGKFSDNLPFLHIHHSNSLLENINIYVADLFFCWQPHSGSQ